jgi:Holliday junction resolvase YEN1
MIYLLIKPSAEESAANPVEKNIFFRVCKLLRANIRPVFVFDGPNAPPKRGGASGRRVDEKARILLKEALDGLGVSHIDAPAEAEAECCKLQILNLVDAVWSQDSDCLMFGCTFWIRELRTAREAGDKSRHIGKTDKDDKRVRLVRGVNLKLEGVHLKKEGCVLFAMLVGGDYDSVGLKGCGTTNALKLVKASLGSSLCSRKSQQECDVWREKILLKFLAKHSINIVVPKTFPKFEILQMYNNPKTNTERFLRDTATLTSNFDQPPREAELLRTSCHYFNFWSKKYYDHIGPVLLSRYLSERNESLPRELVHEIRLTNTHAPKTEAEEELVALEKKLTFSPIGVTILKTREEFERGYSTRPWKTDTSFNASQRVTCEIPTFLLRKVLPLDELERLSAANKKQPPKRKARDDANQEVDATPKKRGRPRKETVTPKSITGASTLASAGRSDAMVGLTDLEEEQFQKAIRRSIQDETLKRSNPPPSAYTPSKTSLNAVRTLNSSSSKSIGPSKPTAVPGGSTREIECIDLTED